MIVLAIDTAGPGCFVCLFDSALDTVLAASGEEIGRGHAERLMGFVDEALEKGGKDLAAVDRIAVTIGPGSFTGIRVGVAAARGLALALGRPSIGITTLQTLGRSALVDNPGKPVLVAMDAKRDELYCQAFGADGVALLPPDILSVDKARLKFSGFSGTRAGSGTYLLTQGVESDGAPNRFDITMVARLGAEADPAVEKPRPLYLRGAGAKPQTGYALERA